VKFAGFQKQMQLKAFGEMQSQILIFQAIYLIAELQMQLLDRAIK
jgi:hypothetical protein